MAALQTAFLGASLSLSNGNKVATRATSGRAQIVAATRIIKQVKVLEPFADKKGTLRSKVGGAADDIKLLTRVQELRLLSKAESSGLLSLLESLGLSLSVIEQLGLLSKAESLGLLSAATDPETPGKLLALAFALLAAGPAVVYFVPEDSLPLVILQVVFALVAVVGGSAAYGASQLVSSLQD